MSKPLLSAEAVALHPKVSKGIIPTWIAEMGMLTEKLGPPWSLLASGVDTRSRSNGWESADFQDLTGAGICASHEYPISLQFEEGR